MNGLPAVITVAATLVAACSLVLIVADYRWTRHEREVFRSCKCGTCNGGRW